MQLYVFMQPSDNGSEDRESIPGRVSSKRNHEGKSKEDIVTVSEEPDSTLNKHSPPISTAD